MAPIGPDPTPDNLLEIKKRLSEKIERLKDLLDDFTFLLERYERQDYKPEWDDPVYDRVVVDLCYEFLECSTCPINELCPRAQRSCSDKIKADCRSCARLHKCVWEGVLKL